MRDGARRAAGVSSELFDGDFQRLELAAASPAHEGDGPAARDVVPRHQVVAERILLGPQGGAAADGLDVAPVHGPADVPRNVLVSVKDDGARAVRAPPDERLTVIQTEESLVVEENVGNGAQEDGLLPSLI